MSQTLQLKIKGIYTNPNDFSEVPPGALAVADNIVIDKESIAETRRGQNYYGNALSVAPTALFNYNNRLICNYSDKLAVDTDNLGTWVDYSGSYNSPEAGIKIHGLEANRNFYFTTSTGIFKLDSVSSAPTKAGMFKALDGYGVTTGATGFLSHNRQIAYRVVWGIKDLNTNLILGAPSQRIVVINTSGGTTDVSLTITLPSDITTSHIIQLYRSSESASVTDEPNDELQLVYQANPTSGEVTALSMVILDNTPNDLMGAYLYTSPSQEGILQANEPPPYCKDMDVYKDHIFYANTKTKQRFNLTLIGVDLPSFGYYVDATTTTAISSPILTNIASTANLRVGMRCVGTGIPANTTILNILSGTSITMTANATANGSVSVEFQDRIAIDAVNYYGGSVTAYATNTFKVYIAATPAENISDTAQELCEVINRTTFNTTVYAYYLSGYNDLPGKILIEERNIGGAAFYLNSTYGESFSPSLPTVNDADNISDNEVKLNRVYISKAKQPEAVPLLSYLDVGSANDPIKRCIALRDSLFIFKDDGIFRITGEDLSSFRVTLLDNTTSIKAPQSAVAFNNQVFIFSDQGVAAVSDSGVSVIGRPIEATLLELASLDNFEDITFSVGYESSRQFILYTVSNEFDTYATQAFVYNSFTNSWTRWIMDRTCGIISKRDNKLYMGQPTNKFVYQERKDFTLTDYADESYDVSITAAWTTN